MRCKVGTFQAPATLGTTKVVTGIADAAGNFIAEKLLVVGAYAYNFNSVSYQNAFLIGGYLFDFGVDFIDAGTATSTGSGNEGTPFSFVVTCGGNGLGYSVLDLRPQLSFGGENELFGYVSAVSSGQLTFTFDRNVRGSDYYIYVAFADVDIDVPGSSFLNDGTISTTGVPAGILNWLIGFGLASHATGQNTGAGGSYCGIGWSAKDSGMGATTNRYIGQFLDFESGVIFTDRMASSIDAFGAVSTQVPIVSAWGSNSVTISGCSGSPMGYLPLIFSGTGLVCRAGDETQPLAIGHQTIDVQCDAKLIVIASEGTTLEAVLSSKIDFSLAFIDELGNQGNFWTGQANDGHLAGVWGARQIGDNSVLRFALATDGTTTFNSVAEFVSLDHHGNLVINWTAVDGTARKFIWFAIGLAAQSDSANIGKGIYKLVPDKKQDTIFFDFETEDEILKKIPDPTAWSSLIGDSNG